MSAEPTSLTELVGELERVVAAARELGCARELEPELLRLARAVCVAPPEQDGGPPVPMRFGLVGASPAMQQVFALLERVAPSDVSVLIQGETGTGKELVARALHDYGPRAKKPFLAENCAAVPANLLESELFGHTKGSFTGAIRDRPGHFVAANGGTVFLDEIGDMPREMQAKLLRVLQDGEVRPVGSNKSISVDVRVLAASHRDLAALCKSGEFREDLYFRLNVITIRLPALREREGDVAHLARFVLGRISREMGRAAVLTPEALAALAAWRWPGNVRELENELRRAVALCDGTIRREDLSPAIAAGTSAPPGH